MTIIIYNEDGSLYRHDIVSEENAEFVASVLISACGNTKQLIREIEDKDEFDIEITIEPAKRIYYSFE